MNTPIKTCTGPECTKAPVRSGLCGGHRQQRRLGKELTSLRPKRAQGASKARDLAGRKQCMNCKEWLEENLFRAHPQSSDGLMVFCDACCLLRRQARKNGMSYTELLDFFSRHGNKCGICSTETPSRYRKTPWSIDHDHSCCPYGASCSKCHRGILCDDCNLGVGRFMDNPELLRAAASYLETSSLQRSVSH